MRFPGRFLMTTTLLLAMTVAAAAQTVQSPRRSPSEREYNSINRSLNRDQQFREQNQQNQFELNQMRQGIQRDNLFRNAPSYGVPAPSRPGCPAGSIGC